MGNQELWGGCQILEALEGGRRMSLSGWKGWGLRGDQNPGHLSDSRMLGVSEHLMSSPPLGTEGLLSQR